LNTSSFILKILNIACLLASSCRFLLFCFFFVTKRHKLCSSGPLGNWMLSFSSKTFIWCLAVLLVRVESICTSTKFTEQYSNYKSSLSRLASHMKAWFVFQNQYIKAGAWNIWFRGTSHNLTSWSLGDPAPWLNRLSF